MIHLLYALLANARSSLKSQRELALENLASRQQLAIVLRTISHCATHPQLRDGGLAGLSEALIKMEEARPKPSFDGGDPSDAKLELGRGIPHRLGWAPRACGVTGQSELSKACELVNPEPCTNAPPRRKDTAMPESAL